jgi:hypothetical protein
LFAAATNGSPVSVETCLQTRSANSVEPGADRGAADRELVEHRQRGAQRHMRLLELRHVAGELLPERERRCVLQMRAPDLDDRGERSALFLQRGFEDPGGGHDLRVQRARRGDMHRRRKDVVRRLSEIDFIVRMHQALLSALAAQQLRGAVGQHLVDVHVALRPRPGLPDDERELRVVAPGEHLVGGSLNRLGLGFFD